MQGQSRQKKMKGDPTLRGGGGGDDDARGSGGGVEGIGNLPRSQKHPLLNELVMEVLFKQYTLLNHDSAKSALARLAELREVCKAWNREIGKILRKETRINVNRLISGYPKGLGWAATTAEDQNDMEAPMLYQYSAPMPQEIGAFENLNVTIKACKDFSSTSVIEWFRLMGSSVKSLELTCTLNCYHQNRFVEKVLKEWCPNLVSLTLRGAKCFESLIENSYFAEASLDNQCKSLKEFVLFADKFGWDRWSQSQSCDLRINQLEGTTGGRSQAVSEVHLEMERNNDLRKFVDDLINYVDQAGEGLGGQRQEENLLNKLVRRPIGLTTLNGMEPRTFGGHVAGYFQGKFSCDAGFESDGGILGQLMKMSRVERFVIKEPEAWQQLFFNGLFAMFFYRRTLWRESLESFECVGSCPMISTYFHVHWIPKNIFSKVGFPLKKIKLVDLKDCIIIEPTSLQKILRGYTESLEELEIKLKNVRRRYSDNSWGLPGLPKLKVLVVECEEYRVVKVTILDVLETFPSLERCELKLGLERHSGSGLDLFFGDGQDNLVGSRGWGNLGSHPLKELKLLDEYVDGRDVERVVDWFPNLKKVELSIVRECGESFQTFWERMKELPLEEVKVSFSARLSRNKGNGLWEKVIGDNVGGFKDLKWLELVHEAEQPFPLTIDFSKEFGKVEKLRFLKLTNFEAAFFGRFAGNEAQEIKENLADIVVNLPGIWSSERLKRKGKLANVD